jgi:hypothetical protein
MVEVMVAMLSFLGDVQQMQEVFYPKYKTIFLTTRTGNGEN